MAYAHVKIKRIFARRVELPLLEGAYRWSGGKSVTVAGSMIVGVETNTGLVGDGEVCPPEPFYFPAYVERVRSGPREFTPLGAPDRRQGFMAASEWPGLGIAPRAEVLRKPIVEVA